MLRVFVKRVVFVFLMIMHIGTMSRALGVGDPSLCDPKIYKASEIIEQFSNKDLLGLPVGEKDSGVSKPRTLKG